MAPHVMVSTDGFGWRRAGASVVAPVAHVGSLPIGEANYDVPSDALWVSPSGNDANAGTYASPLATIERAFAVVTTGRTIVLRAGVYSEGRVRSTLNGNGTALVLDKQGVTVQNAPGEAVWFDGTQALTGFVSEGGQWWVPWTPFNRSPQYGYSSDVLYNAAIASGDWKPLDGSSPDTTDDKYWQFVDYTDPLRACAAWPERLWLDGVQLWQTYTRASLAPGRFFVDAQTNRLWLVDDPTGKPVRITAKQKLFNFLGADQTLRGVGIRGYAPSMPMLGALWFHRPRPTVENVVVRDVSGVAMSLTGTPTSAAEAASDFTLRQVTVERAGNLGVHADRADRGTITNSKILDCNDRFFNPAPSAGGVKMTKFVDLLVTGCLFDGDAGGDESAPGRRGAGKLFWSDQDCRRPVFLRNLFRNSGEQAVFFEITDTVDFHDNVIQNAGTDSLALMSTARARVWNNTFVGTGALRFSPQTAVTPSDARPRAINMVRDMRQPRTTTYDSSYMDSRYFNGYSPIEPFPADGWTPVGYSVCNNLLIDGDVQCYWADEDLNKSTSSAVSVATLGRTVDYNLFQPRRAGGTPTYPWTATTGATTQQSWFSLASLAAATGFEAHGTLLAASDPLPVDSDGYVTSAARHTTAAPIPSTVAALIGVPAGTKHLGPFRPSEI